MDKIGKKIAQLSPQQRALLEEYLKNKKSSKSENKKPKSLPKIEPDFENKYLPFPLTDIQEAYWVGRGHNLELGNVSTHIDREVDYINLDLPKFERAWQKIINRHDALRTIVLDDGTQQILPQIPPYKIQVIDLQNQTEDAITEGGTQSAITQSGTQSVIASKLVEIRKNLSHEVLDCKQATLFKIIATVLSPEKTKLHFSYDALILDGFSSQILLGELYQLYNNPQTELKTLELSFRDYVLALENWKKTPKYDLAKNYWLEKLKTLPPRPELELNQVIQNIKKPKFEVLILQLDQKNWQKLKEKGTKKSLTPSGILLSAFSQILRLWSKKPEFTINLTFFDRLGFHPQVNDIAGDFTSIVLLGVENHSETDFVNQAKQLQQQLWSDIDNHLFTGVKVVRELAKQKRISPQALMPIVFTSF